VTARYATVVFSVRYKASGVIVDADVDHSGRAVQDIRIPVPSVVVLCGYIDALRRADPPSKASY
jgi:hypothetical protein